MNKKIYTFLLLLIIMVPLLTIAMPNSTFAQSNANNMLWGGRESNVQATSGLGNTDPRDMVGSIIRVLLGFLGIIAVIIMLYGGFLWMTAAGNEDNVSKAKQMIGAAIIGLIIILMAFAISQFVISALYNATNATG